MEQHSAFFGDDIFADFERGERLFEELALGCVGALEGVELSEEVVSGGGMGLGAGGECAGVGVGVGEMGGGTEAGVVGGEGVGFRVCVLRGVCSEHITLRVSLVFHLDVRVGAV